MHLRFSEIRERLLEEEKAILQTIKDQEVASLQSIKLAVDSHSKDILTIEAMASAIRSSFSLKTTQKSTDSTDVYHAAAKIRSRIIHEFEPPGITKCKFKHDVYDMKEVLLGQSVKVWTNGKFSPSRVGSTAFVKPNSLIHTWHWTVKQSSCSYTISKDRKTIECFGHESLGGCEAIGNVKWRVGIHSGVSTHCNSISRNSTTTPSIQSIPSRSLTGVSNSGCAADDIEENYGFNEQETFGISLDGDVLYKPMEAMEYLDEPVVVQGKKATVFLELDCDKKTLQVRVESQTSSSMKIQNHGWNLPENAIFQPWIFIGTANCAASILSCAQ
eukprot:jgi/Bigna1/72901/fgenesh1_pg.22_\